MGGIVFLLAGGAIYYQMRLQPPTVAQSSTEAEFCNMTDAGKAALCLCSILDQLGIWQIMPTEILANNHGARQLSKYTSTNPTHPTR
jgi:hypothetical protein